MLCSKSSGKHHDANRCPSRSARYLERQATEEFGELDSPKRKQLTTDGAAFENGSYWDPVPRPQALGVGAQALEESGEGQAAENARPRTSQCLERQATQESGGLDIPKKKKLTIDGVVFEDDIGGCSSNTPDRFRGMSGASPFRRSKHNAEFCSPSGKGTLTPPPEGMSPSRKGRDLRRCTGVATSPRARNRIAKTLAKLALGNKSRRPFIPGRATAVRLETMPQEASLALSQTIKRVVCGADGVGFDSRDGLPAKMHPDKQTNYLTDELQTGARDLKSSERERIENVYKEIARSSGMLEEKNKDFKWNQVTLPWSEFARYLRGKLPNSHIQRLATYFNIKGKVRMGNYIERIGLLVTCAVEKRFRVCFSLLDINGDSIIGARDVFASLTKQPESEENSPHHMIVDENPDWEPRCIKVSCENPQQLGLDFHEGDSSVLEVAMLVQGSAAEIQGVKPADLLMKINHVNVHRMTQAEVRSALIRSDRPLHLLFFRPEKKAANSGGVISSSVFDNLLRALTVRERISTRLKVSIVSARGLRNADISSGGKSDPYCICEVEGKPFVKFQTRVINDCLDPEWNEEKELWNYIAGDTLKFTIRDKDPGTKNDELLGCIALPSSRFLEHGFDQEVVLSNTGKGIKSLLRLKIVNLGEGGIPYDEFSACFAHDDSLFYPALVEELTGISVVPSTVHSQRAVTGRVKITLISASGLRAADVGGKSDPYCIVEIVGRSGSGYRFQTHAIPETVDPVWNKRGELDYTKGESIKFSVFDKDPGSTQNHDALGHVTLTSWRLQPHGFDGELDLMEAGKNITAKLRVKITMPSSTTVADKPADQVAKVVEPKEADPACMQRHDQEMQDVLRMPQFNLDKSSWYIKSFDALCDPDMKIRPNGLVSVAPQCFGVPSPLLAKRVFSIFDVHGRGEIGLLAWAAALDRYFGCAWERSQQRVLFSFLVYDLDGDGLISIQDAVTMAGEVERLAGVLGHPPEGPSEPVCEEMRFLYGKVADATDPCGGDVLRLDLFLFNQIRHSPIVYELVQGALQELGRQEPPGRPFLRLISQAAGNWELVNGDPHFNGLQIAPDGKFHCDGVTDGVVKVIAADGGTANRKMRLVRKKDAHEYIFELDADCARLLGQCVQTGATWLFTRMQPPGSTST